MDLTDWRTTYQSADLTEAALHPDPFVQFQQWLTDAQEAGLPEPNAMTLATADANGVPSARVVLLKQIDSGFVFYTHYTSQKGRELAVNPKAALVFLWMPLERQVRVQGTVSRVSRETSHAYFASRPRAHQLSAAASLQSQIITRQALEKRFAELEQTYCDQPIPLPDHWGGYRLVPEWIEFWQGRPHRLHDRLRYRHLETGWLIERLAP